jgi:hypothetical protein
MPSLSDVLATKLSSKYAPAEQKPPVLAITPSDNMPVNNLRCILPPFNSDPDTLRQFNNQTTGPKNRIWPLPQPIASGSTVTESAPAFSVSSASSSGSVSLGPKTVTFITGSLPLGTVIQTSLQMSQSYQLLSLSANALCEVRIYGSQNAQSFDASRPTGNPVPPEVSSNIVTCVTLNTPPLDWFFQNVMGASGNNPQTATVYVSVIGINPVSAAPVTVTINYLPLET